MDLVMSGITKSSVARISAHKSLAGILRTTSGSFTQLGCEEVNHKASSELSEDETATLTAVRFEFLPQSQ